MLNESADLLTDADHISTAVPATEAVSKIKQEIKGAASNLKEHAAQITSLKDEATINGAKSRAKSLASEVRHDVTDAAADIARTIAHVELPAPIEGWQELLGGLFVPAPRWPSEHLTLAALLSRARPAALLVLGVTILFIGVAVVLLVVLPVVVPLAVLLAPVAALVGGAALLRRQQAAAAPPPPSPPPPADWREAPDEAFADPAQRAEMKAEILGNVRAASLGAADFNAFVASRTSLAVYGCGILAAVHVGGLKALERHGLQYAKLTTLAGVSAGAVVVACLSVGYKADELFALIERLPFGRLARPELGALLRMLGNNSYSVLKSLFGGSRAARRLAGLAGGTGPGLNSGYILETMIGEALRAKCGDADITLGEVLQRFGKRVVIVATELDTGRERQLTPEDDGALPLRVAVRMSMGVPGVMEPLRYDGHVYCDGGMTNDFPLGALPNDGGRLGLLVRPRDWYAYKLGPLDHLVGASALKEAPAVRERLDTMGKRLKSRGIYPVRDALDLMTTSMAVMMDANLLLQMREPGNGGEVEVRDATVGDLAPEVLTLCGGALQPFDFSLPKELHRELFECGQLAAHLLAAQHGGGGAETGVMSDEHRLQALCLLLSLDYPK